jgi:hypothetical protein
VVADAWSCTGIGTVRKSEARVLVALGYSI